MRTHAQKYFIKLARSRKQNQNSGLPNSSEVTSNPDRDDMVRRYTHVCIYITHTHICVYITHTRMFVYGHILISSDATYNVLDVLAKPHTVTKSF